ncbi:MAG: hypothetical protein RBU37_21315 [Myxococcota bacterium]|nr:hypothetical protein [Myxococcota bacterium]
MRARDGTRQVVGAGQAPNRQEVGGTGQAPNGQEIEPSSELVECSCQRSPRLALAALAGPGAEGTPWRCLHGEAAECRGCGQGFALENQARFTNC